MVGNKFLLIIFSWNYILLIFVECKKYVFYDLKNANVPHGWHVYWMDYSLVEDYAGMFFCEEYVAHGGSYLSKSEKTFLQT